MIPKSENGRISLTLSREDGFTLNASFDLPPVGITAIFGPSGSGKTTLLRSVAGLERAEGLVRIGDEVWQDTARHIFLPTWERHLGYVFQEASLFPHLSAWKNLEFAVKRSHTSGSQERLETAINLLGIRHLLKRKPAALSGGERQRVAIARAMATDPKIMLFDEPLAALDFARKAEIIPWLQKVKTSLEIPMLYVTHSAEEVVKLADHIVVLEEGRMKAFGPLEEVLQNINVPVDLGGDVGVVVRGKVASVDQEWELMTVSTGHISLVLQAGKHKVGDELNLRIFAKEVGVSLQPVTNSSYRNCLKGIVMEIAADIQPSESLVKIDCGGDPLIAKITKKAASELKLAPGSEVYALVKAVAIVD